MYFGETDMIIIIIILGTVFQRLEVSMDRKGRKEFSRIFIFAVTSIFEQKVKWLYGQWGKG